jgi:hypothetical protein
MTAILAGVRSSERFGLEVPDDFPLDDVEALHETIRRWARGEDGSDRNERREFLFGEWSGGLSGVYLRFRACADADDCWRESIAAHGLAPPFPERYEQERALYGFFSNGLSSLECLYYGLCFVGELLRPGEFSAPSDPRGITPRLVASLYGERWPESPLSQGLTHVDGSDQLADLRGIRNILSHRAAPGRHHSLSLGGEGGQVSLWMGQMLSPETTAIHRRYLAKMLRLLTLRAQSFVGEPG